MSGSDELTQAPSAGPIAPAHTVSGAGGVSTGGQDAAASAVPQPGTAGRYTLGVEIARGGMGVVYRGFDTTLGREVAVKVLQQRFGPDSGTARRFVEEARITGQLQHPGIPAVHDLGTLPDGRPFLTMKLIKGDTLELLLACRPDPASERGRFVAVFEQVCHAVAYAHAHQVIHRDLKPANVMVGAFGEVQVMDWGLAKVLASREGSRPESDPECTRAGTEVLSLRDSDGSFTQAGSVLGTPAFMPPEQAVGATGKVDSRSDVFGLGGLLAVILTGQPPFVGTSGETTRVKAAQGDVADCLARLDGCGAEPELVALCKRCLRPRPADRPADAGEVARAVAELRAAADERARQAELDRVKAEGEKAAAEARSLERRRRRRLWLGAAAAVVIAALGGLGAVLAVQRRANADLAAKNAELAEEQAKVQARFELARKAIATFHTGVSEDVLLKNDQFKELRTRLLKEAAGFYGELEKSLPDENNPRARRLLAASYFELGELTTKIGSQPEALALHRKALAIRRELAAAADADVETRLEVARSLHRVGVLLKATGQAQGALARFEEMRDLAAALEKESPTEAVRAALAQSHGNIALVLGDAGKYEESMAAHHQALALREKLVHDHPTVAEYQRGLATSYHNLGHLLDRTGPSEEELASYLKALAIYQKLADAHPADSQFSFDVATCYNNIGQVLARTGKPAEALEAYRKAQAIRRRLVDANPAVAQFQSYLAGGYLNIGIVLAHTGHPAEALHAYEQARDILQKLADANPAVAEYRLTLAQSHNNLGALLSRLGRPEEALPAYRKALAIYQQLADAFPTTPGYQSALAEGHNNLGTLLSDASQYAEALMAYGQAREIYQKLVDHHPAAADFRNGLAITDLNLGQVHAQLRQFAQAFAAFDRGLGLEQKLADQHAANTLYTMVLGMGHAYRGGARVRAGQPREAVADLRRAVELLAKSQTSSLDARFERARALALLAGLGAAAKSEVSAGEAATFADQAVAGLRDAVRAGWAQSNELKEPDFDPLRSRPDFQQLVTQLATKAALSGGSKHDLPPGPGNK